MDTSGNRYNFHFSNRLIVPLIPGGIWDIVSSSLLERMLNVCIIQVLRMLVGAVEQSITTPSLSHGRVFEVLPYDILYPIY